MMVLATIVLTHVKLVLNTKTNVIHVMMLNIESMMPNKIVDVSMDIMMPDMKLVQLVTSNVTYVLMVLLAKFVLVTDKTQHHSVKFVMKVNLMTDPVNVVNNVQTIIPNTVQLVLTPNVLNVT